MTRGDKILMAAILLLALVGAAVLYGPLLLPGAPGAAHAVLTVGGRTAHKVELPHRGSFRLEGKSGPVKVEVAGTRVRVLEAHCPGGNCLRQGWIEGPGESIVCVPGEIVIRMEGKALVDAVTH